MNIITNDGTSGVYGKELARNLGITPADAV